jgi:diguanylate cyclase (GGDEF)-like protein
MACLLAWLVNGVSSGANAIDEAKTQQAVQAMVSGLLESAGGLVLDNAKWDDAVDNVYGTANQKWMLDTWGYSTANENYDVAIILDGAGKTVAAFSGGSAVVSSAQALLGHGLDSLIGTLPKGGTVYPTVVGMLRTSKGVAVVAAAPILPHTEGRKIPEAAPRVLVYAKTLTPDYVASLGKRLILDGLEIAPDTDGLKSSAALTDSSDAAVGYLRWNSDHPGDKAMAVIQLPAIIATLAMTGCMLALAWLSSHLSLGLQRRERQAWDLANTDALTQLPNRHAALRLLTAKTAEQNADPASGLTVMLADLDGFKEVNDIYGHHIGDRLLKSVSAGFAVIAQKFNATLSRLGGDEFAFILDGDEASTRAAELSRTVLGFLQTPIEIDGRITRVGMSIGIAASTGVEKAAELLRRADVAMYAAKEHGKNQFLPYGPELDAERNSRIRLAEQMKLALASKQIGVEFQPIVNAASHEITGVEALARWTLPDGRKVSPDEFIGITEEFGLIDELGNQVLAIACREAVSWPGILLSVNISPAQFRNPNFLDNLMAIVDKIGLPRERLELEITEGYMIDNRDKTRPIIEFLLSEGFKVTLDDFGSGYSSIGYLREFNFGKLKLDKSLTEGMVTDVSARSIIIAAASIAKGMDMTVTGEGVEHKEQADMLRLLGCDTLQGYYFGRPQSAEAFAALLEDQDRVRKMA